MMLWSRRDLELWTYRLQGGCSTTELMGGFVVRFSSVYALSYLR